ncbi:mechanosensitive ion channel family protein [Roseivirga sp. BDSF3-8]|uniref:mechanosensitive ion channel family protein n=1 Tax=Roseivirga sp. BDSF3-8 TaxID=3241598 RepID=UPI0035322267
MRTKFQGFFLITYLILFILTPLPATPQSLPLMGRQDNTEEERQPSYPPDELNRRTPRGAILGYLDAMSNEDYEKAARYLDTSDLDGNLRNTPGTELARRLQVLLDQNGKIEPGALLSDQSSGQYNDNLAANLDQVGTIHLENTSIPVLVEQTTGKEGGPVWLISSTTLQQLPEDVGKVSAISVNRLLPDRFIINKWGGVPVGHWLVMVALIFASYMLALLITAIVVYLIKLLGRKRMSDRALRLVNAFAIPIRIYMAVWILIWSAQRLGISIIVRQYFSQATVIVAWIAILILVWRLIDVFSSFGERRMTKRNNMGGLSAIMFFRRGFKFLLIAVGIITILDTFGFDVTTGIAALGIGGIALALGAQKSVENLVGSLTVIFDQPVRVGDFCKVGDTVGTVEKIGMRSTRIRTLGRTIVTIPNGDFSAQRIENYAHRDRILFNPTISLRYETSPDQMRYILVEIRSLLYAHPRVDPDPARVRFLGFGADSLNVGIHAYVFTQDFNDFLEIQEDLNLRIADIVQASGTGFAFPSQTLYMARDTGLSEERTKAAEARVKEWKEKGEMQLPKFDPERVEELRGSIQYPPLGSSSQPKE